MYAHSNESLSLLKDIMNVQEELEKFQVDLPSKDDLSRLSVRDSKVSSSIHRLRDPVPGRSSQQNTIYFRDGLQSKITNHDLSWNEDSLTEKSNGRGNRDLFQFSQESTRRENLRGARDLGSKKPPVKPIYNRSASNTPYGGITEYNREVKDLKEKRATPSNANYKKHSQENYSQHKVVKDLMTDFSPRVSPYNDCKTTKTHLMTKSPVFHAEDMRNLQEKLVPQSVLGNNIMKNVKRTMPNSCDISRDYGHPEFQPVRSDKFENRDQSKKENLNSSMCNEAEYNSTFAGKRFDLQRPVLGSKDNTPLVDSRQQMNFKEANQRSQSANIRRDANVTEKRIKEKENQFLIQNPIRQTRHEPGSLRHLREGDVDGNKEIGSTRESEGIEATGTFGHAYFEKSKNFLHRPPAFGKVHTETDKEKRIKTYPAMPLPFENDHRIDRPRYTTMEGIEAEENELLNGKSSQNKGTVEKVQLMKVVIELRNQLHEKDLEILDLRNIKVANEMENKELQIQVSDITKVSKRNEDSIEKLQHQIECQEKEIEFLKKCKQRLEENSRTNARAAAELKDTSGKIIMYEQIIEDKNRENLGLSEKVHKNEYETRILREENQKLSSENQKLKEDLIKSNNQLVALMNEAEENKKKLLEFRLIEGKLGELEELQNLLIKENDHLRKQINEQQIKAKENEIQCEKMNKEEVTQLSLINKKLKEVEEYAKKLLIIVESTLKGEELPIELILKHNRGQENSHRYKKYNENDSKESTMRQLIQENLNAVETLHHAYQECMDKLCESYVAKYGNDCNLQ